MNEEKQRAAEELNEKLNKARTEKKDAEARLDDVLSEEKKSHVSNIYREWDAKVAELKSCYDAKTQELVEKREKLEDKIEKVEKLRHVPKVIAAVYAVALLILFFALKLSFIPIVIISYGALLALGGFAYRWGNNFLKSKIASINREIEEINEDPNVKDYSAKDDAIWNEISPKIKNAKERFAELCKEEERIRRELSDIEDVEKSILWDIEELDFNYAYNDCILFWGTERGNRYDLYLDGRPYDSVKGHRIVKIVLSPGIHSFKVENTCYNIDGSVIYSYEFPTRQISAGENISATAIVCEIREIRQVGGAEFQRVTKTNLL